MRGCGFFIKPRLVITCSHIIGRDAESGTEIKLYKWNSRINCLHGARLFKNFPKDDIAFIETRDCNPTYAPLSDDGAQLWHPLIAIGFPQNGNAFDSCSGIYESNTPWCDNENDDVITYTKFKDCQIEEGYSGGPLLNLRTHKVMGVVN
jgi:S1-C subfamily serine protease